MIAAKTLLGEGAVAAYSSSVDCMSKFKAGAFGTVGTAAARTGYENCLKTTTRITNNTAPAGMSPTANVPVGGITATAPAAAALRPNFSPLRDTTGVGAYVPNCASTYRPCGEIEKAKANGIAVTSSLQAKCGAWTQACANANPLYSDQSAGIITNEMGQQIDPATGLPVATDMLTTIKDWVSANQTTVGVVGLVVAGLLVWKLIK